MNQSCQVCNKIELKTCKSILKFLRKKRLKNFWKKWNKKWIKKKRKEFTPFQDTNQVNFSKIYTIN